MARVPRKPLSPDARTLGAAAFAAITAVEGLALDSESRARIERLRASSLPPDRKRAEVRRAYGADDGKS